MVAILIGKIYTVNALLLHTKLGNVFTKYEASKLLLGNYMYVFSYA